MDLKEVSARIVAKDEEARFQRLMQERHYLGALPAMGGTIRYAARHHGRWLALAVFPAPALKCGPRDRWIGWDRAVQLHRLHLVSGNSRLTVLPGGPRNLGSRALAPVARRLVRDWPARFGHELLLLETCAGPARLHGTACRAATRTGAGLTRGFGRAGAGCREHGEPKRVPLPPLCRDARARLRSPRLEPGLRKGVPKVTLSKQQMMSMPELFREVENPRRKAGRRHTLSSILSLSLAATLSGARGTGRSANGPATSRPGSWRVSASASATGPASGRAGRRSAGCSSGPARNSPAARSGHGPRPMADRTARSRSTERRCAAPWTGTGTRPMRPASWATTVAATTVKKAGMRVDANQDGKRTNGTGTVLPLPGPFPTAWSRGAPSPWTPS